MMKHRELPIRVLLVESIHTLHNRLAALINNAPGLTLVGATTKGVDAITLASELHPDVIAVNTDIYGTDGFAITQQVMCHCPCPVVMYSATITSATTTAATAVGALTVIQTPSAQSTVGHEADSILFLQTLRVMAGVPVVTRFASSSVRQAVPMPTPDQPYELLAIAASTGGPSAIQQVVSQFRPDFPLPIVVVQHIARTFVNSLAEWLSSVTLLPVAIVHTEQRLRPGHLYLAPSNHHLQVGRRGWVQPQPGEMQPSPYCPSADIMFHSVAQSYGRRAIGLILSGMGDDGARGLAALHKAGGFTLAQDEASCVVYGMPQAAIRLGAVEQVGDLDKLSSMIRQQIGYR